MRLQLQTTMFSMRRLWCPDIPAPPFWPVHPVLVPGRLLKGNFTKARAQQRQGPWRALRRAWTTAGCGTRASAPSAGPARPDLSSTACAADASAHPVAEVRFWSGGTSPGRLRNYPGFRSGPERAGVISGALSRRREHEICRRPAVIRWFNRGRFGRYRGFDFAW